MERSDSACLLINRNLVERQRNVALRIAPCERHPDNPLPVDGRRDWTQNNLTVNLYRDAEYGSFYGWRYENVPTEGVDDDGRMLPMRSDDGLAWRTAGGPIPLGAVIRDGTDPDPGRRFKMVYQGGVYLNVDGKPEKYVSRGDMKRGLDAGDGVKRAMLAACSPDGVGPGRSAIRLSSKTSLRACRGGR